MFGVQPHMPNITLIKTGLRRVRNVASLDFCIPRSPSWSYRWADYEPEWTKTRIFE